MESQSKQKIYTPAEVAQCLGFCVGHVYNLVHARKLGCVKVGNRVFITGDHLKAWLEKNSKFVEVEQ